MFVYTAGEVVIAVFVATFILGYLLYGAYWNYRYAVSKPAVPEKWSRWSSPFGATEYWITDSNGGRIMATVDPNNLGGVSMTQLEWGQLVRRYRLTGKELTMKKPPRVTIAFTVAPDERDALTSMAREQQTTVSKLVGGAVSRFLAIEPRPIDKYEL